MSEKKTILLIDNSLYITGSIHSTLQTTEQLKSFYNFVFVLPSKSIIFPLVTKRGFRSIPLPMLEINRSLRVLIYLPMLMLNTLKLIRIIQREKVDILHINDIYNMLGIMIRIFYPKMKVIYYVRLLKSSYIRPMYPIFSFFVRNFSHRIICVSSAVQHDIGSPANSLVIYTTFVSENLPAWNGIRNPEKLRILYLGNYIPGKGHRFALYTLSKVVKSYPGTRLSFVGGSNQRSNQILKEELKELAARLNLLPNIDFGDENFQVEKLMKSFDVVLNLSESESFSMICLEAISYGVPLIVTDCGGPTEITDNGKVAFLVPNKDHNAAAHALIKLIESPAEAKRKAEIAKAFSKVKFDAVLAIEKLKQVYDL